MNNPFTPTFGIVPPYAAGRDMLLNHMDRAFNNWPGDPYLSTILIGPRGSGKTAMLSLIGDAAREQGWLVVDTVAASDILNDILEQTLSAAAEHLEKEEKKHLTSLTLGSFLGMSWSLDDETELSWRTRMRELLRELRRRDIGLLITVDEVKADIPEMIQLISSYQLFVRDGDKIAIAMAGLPVNVGDLLANDDISFLRRSRQQYLGKIADNDVRSAFRRTVESGDKEIDPEALAMAVDATDGFAYMMQLVGYSMWDVSGENKTISASDASQGIDEAKQDFKNSILRSTWRDLSKGDRNFLIAMLADNDGSTLTQIADRIGKTNGYAYTYKRRLEQAGVIDQDGDMFRFAMPGMREYVAEQSQ